MVIRSVVVVERLPAISEEDLLTFGQKREVRALPAQTPADEHYRQRRQ